MEKKTNKSFEVVFCIVNAGYSEKVMEVVRSVGATGGTVIKATATANPQAEKLFGITISPEKEIVMIVVEKNIKDNVLKAIYENVGLNTRGSGIAFSLPITDVVGIKQFEVKTKEENK